MIKDKFNWRVKRVERKYNPYGENVHIHLDGVSCFNEFVTPADVYTLREEIKDLMNSKAIDCGIAPMDFDGIIRRHVEMDVVRPKPPLGLSRLDNYIEKVIFNDPATIVLWKDGTKTVVKAQDEEFDPMVGLAMCISKKALGNQGNYFEVFKKWCEPWYEEHEPTTKTITLCDDAIVIRFADCINYLKDSIKPIGPFTINFDVKEKTNKPETKTVFRKVQLTEDDVISEGPDLVDLLKGDK